MSATPLRMLVPHYVRRFACIGGACEDSCCQGWNVAVDRDTYQLYRSCADADLGALMAEKVTRNRKNPTPANYAKIKMNDDSSCPFLDSERLCAIQKTLGEPFLSLSCTSYPRSANVVNDVLEMSMVMSCPEAARLALLDSAVMEFDEIPAVAGTRHAMSASIDTRGVPSANAGHYFWELRIFTITVLQSRAYALGDRLILLGMFFRALGELVARGNSLEIPSLIASYTVNIERGSYRDHLASLPMDNPVQMLLLKQIVDVSLLPDTVTQRYVDCLTEFSLGIGNVEGALAEDVLRQYGDACANFHDPFMERHGYMLEHYLVNFVFKNLFPFNGQDDLFENYVKLVVQYALLRTFLIGLAGHHKDALNTGHVITLIQSFTKTIEHSNSYLSRLHALLVSSGSATMAHMVLLIRSGSRAA